MSLRARRPTAPSRRRTFRAPLSPTDRSTGAGRACTADMRFQDKVRAHPYLSDLIVHVADTASNGTA